MAKIIRIVTHRNFLLPLAIVLGLTVGNIGTWIKHLTIPALAIVMVISMTQVSVREFASVKKVIIPTLYTLLFNFLIFSIFMLVMVYFLIDDKMLQTGFVVLATAPPGVAIAPFAYITGADEKFSIFGMVGAYIASLILIPLCSLIFIGREFVNFGQLILIFAELIVAPMIIAQILVKFRMEKYIIRWRGAIVNWGLFIVIFAVIYLNKSVIFKDFKSLGIISLISLITISLMWALTALLLKRAKIQDKLRKSFILAAVIKNSGFSAAAALSLFGEKASLPSAIFSVFLIIFLILISIKKDRKSERKGF